MENKIIVMNQITVKSGIIFFFTIIRSVTYFYDRTVILFRNY